MSKKHNKPVGKLNPKIIRGGKAESAPNRFIFPNTKNEIEKKVASTFLNLISKNEKYDLSVGYRLIENPENNLDFFVECPESFYLELTEITPPGKMKGGYEKLSYEHNIGEHLEKVLSLILRKSDKYLGLDTSVNLLMYITDDRSLPSPSMEKALMFMLNQNDHKFKNVYAFYPLLENDGPIIQFYPNSFDNISSEEIDRIKLMNVKNLKIK
jgi:hypothetical protein|tara:strand:- start:1757 stop:2392 length:636 start_codon:yes stop_codon:yes gene_type:complete